MQYTNVSMPIWGEGHLVGGIGGTVFALGALGIWLGLASSGQTRREGSTALPSIVVAPATAALMFIVLRGSLYEVLGYMGLLVAIYYLTHRAVHRDIRKVGRHT